MTPESIQYIEQLISDPGFRDWCRGTASKETICYWEGRLAGRENQAELVYAARQMVIYLGDDGYPTTDAQKIKAWERLEKRLSRQAETPAMKSSPLTPGRSYRGWIFTAAAIAALLLISLILFKNVTFIRGQTPLKSAYKPPALKKITTAFGERKSITLDSGTKITLNANSALHYRGGWIFNDTVKVSLKGEAYFDVVNVKTHANRVFMVETVEGSISVLGTRFMVASRQDVTRVILEEGSVSIRKKGSSGETGETFLRPSELAEFSIMSDEINIKRVNTEVFTSWTRGMFVFDQTPLTAVAQRIEDTFGVEFVIADPSLLTKEVSGSVESTDANTVISALSKTLDAPVVHKGKLVVMGNTAFEPILTNQTDNPKARNND